MDPALNAYILRHPELCRQDTLEVHYTDHHRGTFRIVAATYALEFLLRGPGVGLRTLARTGAKSPLDPDRPSLNLVLRAPDGVTYQTAAATRPARINIFRHGPHYHDVHVFDLAPTSPSGEVLPLFGEVVFHAYPDRLYVEVRLHPTAPLEVAEAAVVWHLDARACARWHAEGGPGVLEDGDSVDLAPPPAGSWIGASGPGGMIGWILGAPEGTARLQLQSEAGGRTLRQHVLLQGTPMPWVPGEVHSLACRVAMEEGLAELAAVAAIEAAPLRAPAFTVGTGGRFAGYDAVRGHYVIEPAQRRRIIRNETFDFYDNPQDHDIIPLEITGDGSCRRIYVKHRLAGIGRIEAGVVTDASGDALPVLVQGSKNFCGENEEPFYDPGDSAYAETYFPLILEPGMRLELRSYHARQNWGAHPLKQISSLQAWMPYYQMSVGVTETTCYVPFRFGGHGGIWIADLRGVSGQMWKSQPQYDNVGGHRFFHYRSGGTEHFPRYLRSRFSLISPNMARWGMDYVTEEGEARIAVDVFEVPQTDQTRDFVRLRIDFDRPLSIDDPAANLALVSLDTTTQTLRYGALGFTGPDGQLEELPAEPADRLPDRAVLAAASPLIALYRCRPESHTHGNNAIIVRHYGGCVGGTEVGPLALGTRALSGGNRMVALTLGGTSGHFQPGDYLEVDLLILPYGRVGDGPEVPCEERRRFGLAAPGVVATSGEVIETFPARIRLDRDGGAEFRLSGGASTLPVLLEGFRDYAPPVLEARTPDGWRPVVLTAGGREGHQVYLTSDRRYGFVFLLETDGGEVFLRVRP